jgi:hypothetical protein
MRDGASRTALARIDHCPARGLDPSQDGAGVTKKRDAGVREVHSTGRAYEEARAQLVLETPDLAADGGLRDAKPPGRTTDVSLLGDRDEVFDLGEAHVASLHGRGAAARAEIQRALDPHARHAATSRAWASRSLASARSPR